MHVGQLAELLSTELGSMIREEGLAAEVQLTPAEPPKGPFVEVRPTVTSSAPEMSIHVMHSDSVALSIGETAAADWEGGVESILETVRSLALAMFHGHLLEEVIRDRRGRVLASTLVLANDGERKVVWKRSSAAGRIGLRSKSRELVHFPAYPMAN